MLALLCAFRSASCRACVWLSFTLVFVLCFPDLLFNCSLGSKAVAKYFPFDAV